MNPTFTVPGRQTRPVIAPEVHQHQVLRALLRVRQEIGAQGGILFRGRPRPGASDRCMASSPASLTKASGLEPTTLKPSWSIWAPGTLSRYMYGLGLVIRRAR